MNNIFAMEETYDGANTSEEYDVSLGEHDESSGNTSGHALDGEFPPLEDEDAGGDEEAETMSSTGNPGNPGQLASTWNLTPCRLARFAWRFWRNSQPSESQGAADSIPDSMHRIEASGRLYAPPNRARLWNHNRQATHTGLPIVPGCSEYKIPALSSFASSVSSNHGRSATEGENSAGTLD